MKESKLKTVLTAIIDLLYVGILWLLCSLPILTLGPATTALYYATVKRIRHERGHLTKVFFAGFRQNFRQSFPMWLLYLAALGLAWLDWYGYRQLAIPNSGLLSAFSGILALPALLSFPWMFAYISRFSNSFGGSLKFVLFLTARNLGKTLILTGELVLFLGISWMLPQLLPLLPGAFALLMSLTIEPVFQLYTADQSTESGDDWYNES